MTREELFIRNLFALNNDTKLKKELKLSVLTSFTRIGRILTFKYCLNMKPDKGCTDKTSQDKTSQGTKRPKTKRPQT